MLSCCAPAELRKQLLYSNKYTEISGIEEKQPVTANTFEFNIPSDASYFMHYS